MMVGQSLQILGIMLLVGGHLLKRISILIGVRGHHKGLIMNLLKVILSLKGQMSSY